MGPASLGIVMVARAGSGTGTRAEGTWARAHPNDTASPMATARATAAGVVGTGTKRWHVVAAPGAEMGDMGASKSRTRGRGPPDAPAGRVPSAMGYYILYA